MEKHTSLELYRSGTGDELYKTQKYIYRIELSKLSATGFELIGTQFVSLNEYRDVKPSKHRRLGNGDILFKEAELFGAPEEYLIKNNYEKRSD